MLQKKRNSGHVKRKQSLKTTPLFKELIRLLAKGVARRLKKNQAKKLEKER